MLGDRSESEDHPDSIQAWSRYQDYRGLGRFTNAQRAKTGKTRLQPIDHNPRRAQESHNDSQLHHVKKKNPRFYDSLIILDLYAMLQRKDCMCKCMETRK